MGRMRPLFVYIQKKKKQQNQINVYETYVQVQAQNGKMELSFRFVGLFYTFDAIPSVALVLSAQISWIGRHLARSCGGGYCSASKKNHRSKLSKTDEPFEEPDGKQ